MSFKESYTLNEIFWVHAYDNESKKSVLKPFVLSENLEEIKFLDGSEKILCYNPKKNISKDVSMLLFFNTQFEYIHIYTSEELLQETLKSNKKVSVENNQIKIPQSKKYTLNDIKNFCSTTLYNEKSLKLLNVLFKASAKNIMLDDIFYPSNLKNKIIKHILKSKNIKQSQIYLKSLCD